MFSSSPLSAPPPLVVDWGSYSLRIGTAGDALPRCLLPAVVGLPHPQLCCSSNNGSSSSNGSRSKWRGGLSSNCRLLASGGPAAAGGAAAGSLGYGGSAAAFICPLNPLQKRDHVDVYPVVVYEHPGFALAAASAARLKQQQGDTDWLTGAADADVREEEEDGSNRRAGSAREQRREHSAFSAAAGSSCTLPGAYHVDMNGFESLIEAACGADALDEGSLEGRAVLLSEPNAMDKPLRDAYAELMFETFKTSQLFLGKKAALTCFGCARTSSLVVDVGHSHASACGVQEGYVLQKSIREIPFAAQQLSILSRLSLGSSCAALTPGYAVTRVPLAAAAAADGALLEGAGSAAAGEEFWGGGSSGGTSEAAVLHACKKSHLHSNSNNKGSSSFHVPAAGGGSRHVAAASSGGRSGLAGGGVKGELVRAGAVGGTGLCCSTDRRYREAVEVAACPHVTHSYRDWACFHLAEVLAQVLGECHPTAAAARKQRQELLLSQQQQGQWTAAAASVGGALLQQQQRGGGGGGGGRRRGTSAGGQSLKSTTAGTGRGKTEEDVNAGEQQLLQQADDKQQSAGGRRAGGGQRRRSSGTSAGGAAAGDRKRGSGSSEAAARGQRSSGRGKGAERGDDEEEEPPYLLPDGTPVAADTVTVVREGVAEALFSVPLRLQVFSKVWTGSSSKTVSAAAAAFPATFVDAWRCCSAAGGSAGSSSLGRRHTSSSADAAGAAAVGGSSCGAPLWSAYEAAAIGATYPRFLSRVALSDLIKDTLSSCGRGAARRDVTATIIPTGGGSLYPGFLPRFKAELRALAEDSTVGSLLSQHSSAGASAGGWGSSSSEAAAALLSVSQPLRVVASPVDVERHFASWIGGSILSCLGSFTQFAVTKEEYDEYGARVSIGRKCP